VQAFGGVREKGGGGRFGAGGSKKTRVVVAYRFEWRTSGRGRKVQLLICSTDLEKGERGALLAGLLHREGEQRLEGEMIGLVALACSNGLLLDLGKK
jgi:hypothetical protein